jgi:hypothetical protein
VGVMRQKFVSESDFYLNHEFLFFTSIMLYSPDGLQKRDKLSSSWDLTTHFSHFSSHPGNIYRWRIIRLIEGLTYALPRSILVLW